MSQLKAKVRGRYWGPSSPGEEKLIPESPSQASILLERINARARARKAAQLNNVGRPVESSPTKFDSGEKDESKPNIAAGIDNFLKQMRNASDGIENVADDKTERKKRKKNKNNDNGDELNLTLNGEVDDHNKETLPKKKKKDKGNNSLIRSEAKETGTSIDCVENLPKMKKKQNDFVHDSKGKEYHINTTRENLVHAHEVGNVTPKKKKKKHSEMDHDQPSTEVIISSVANVTVVKSPSNINKKGSENEKINDTSSDVEKNINLSFDSEVKFSKKKKKMHNDSDISQHFTNSGAEDENASSNLELDSKKSRKQKKQGTVSFWKEEDLPVISIDDMSRKEEVIVKTKKKKKRDGDFKVVAVNGETEEYEIYAGVPEDNIHDETQGKKKNKKRKKDNDGEMPGATNNVNSLDTKLDSGTLLVRDDQDLMNMSEEKARAVTKRVKKSLARARRKKKSRILAKQERKEKKNKDFTLLGEVRSAQRKKLGRTLPHWLAHPTVVGRDLQEDSAGLGAIPGLAEWLRTALEQNSVAHFFPIQRAVIPELLASAGPLALRFRPRDICVSAPTGSGKTLAYVLPILQALSGRTVPRIRALILLPVQELAIQVYKVFETYSRGSGLKIGLAVGQNTFGKEQVGLVGSDYRGHHCRVDVLVATPGRLTDHLTLTPGLDLSALRYLVLDEADRMLAAEGGEWVTRIEQAVNSQDNNGLTIASHPPHRLLFSATLSHDPELLQSIILHHPRLFTVTGSTPHPSTDMITGQYIRPAELVEEYVVVDDTVKPLVLHHLISGRTIQGEKTGTEAGNSKELWQRVLVFTNSRAATHRLAILLSLLAPHRQVAEFSSSAGKNKRHQIVSQFSAGKIDILVSSDAMARGLDIPNIEHVVSYDVTSANTYVHRIGRTARAGRPGTALSLVTKATLPEFKRRLRNGGEAAREVTVSVDELEPYEALYIDALAKMKEKLQEEEQQGREKLEAAARGRKSLKKGVMEQ